MKNRKSGLELLRIFAMIFIIFAHINNRNIGNGFGYAEQNTTTYLLLMVLEACSLWTVSSFILITGYFMCENNHRSLTKVFSLLFQLIVFTEIKYILTAHLIGEELQLRYFIYNLLPVDYYVILYCVLYIISPYINIFLSKLDRTAFNKLLLTIIIIFPLWNYFVNYCKDYFNSTMYGMSTIGLYGNQEGYTIITFILLYIIGAYIKKYNIKINSLICIIVSALCITCIYDKSVVQLQQNIDISAWNIDNPFNIIVAVGIFLTFKNIQFSSKVINELSKGIFTAYLMQDFLIKRVLNIEYIVAQPWYLMLGLELICAIAIIIFSYIVYKIYNLLTSWFFELISPIIDILDIGVYTNE